MTLADYRNSRGEPLINEPGDAGHHERHPSAGEYILIGLILTAITAAEVGIYYLDISRTLLVGTLAIMSVTKFTIVVLWFMHLKFDNRLFRYLFLLGLLGAIALFTVVLTVQAANVV